MNNSVPTEYVKGDVIRVALPFKDQKSSEIVRTVSNNALYTNMNVICAMQIMLAILVDTYISALMNTSGR